MWMRNFVNLMKMIAGWPELRTRTHLSMSLLTPSHFARFSLKQIDPHALGVQSPRRRPPQKSYKNNAIKHGKKRFMSVWGGYEWNGNQKEATHTHMLGTQHVGSVWPNVELSFFIPARALGYIVDVRVCVVCWINKFGLCDNSESWETHTHARLTQITCILYLMSLYYPKHGIVDLCHI